MRPLIRWAGSKRPLVDRLRHYWPGEPARYIEPFAGSACLFFELLPAEAVLGDLNSELIRAYRSVRRNPAQVIDCFNRLPTGERGYYAVRELRPSDLAEAEAAARFLYLNRNCFNGLYRTNRSGEFNVPYGPPKRPIMDFEERIRAASLALARAELCDGDFMDTLTKAEPGDFVYLDPPYAISSRRIFAEYGPKSFSVGDLERLSDALEGLDALGVQFVLNYADSSEARWFFRRWRMRRVWTRRNIAGFTGARRGTYEILATNIETNRHDD